MTTADIEDTTRTHPLATERAEDRRPVTQESVGETESSVGALDDLGRQAVTIENLGLKPSLHEVDVIGGGPAGAMAALAAIGAGARVRVFEKSAFPRHKVCGEFLSPDILTLLRRAGCADAFLTLGPTMVRHMALHFGSRVISHALPAPAYGLSRAALDHLLLTTAAARGAEVIRETHTPHASGCPVVQSSGRAAVARGGDRLFGFKTHYRGRVDDVVSLFFFDGCYVGVSAVEGGAINVCGLAPERLLQDCGFQPEQLLERCDALQARMHGCERTFDWLITGPLVTGWTPQDPSNTVVYPAGDALGFIDPFTGSGILNAMSSGHAAGLAAATGVPVPTYLASRRRALRRPFVVSALCRWAIAAGWAGSVASVVPGRWLFHLTRPSV